VWVASRVRDMFEQARKRTVYRISSTKSNCRAAGPPWCGPMAVATTEREKQTLKPAAWLNGRFEANEWRIIIAATNRKDVLDLALLRPGPL